MVLAVLAFDLGVMHRDAHEIGVREILNMSALYIGLGLAWAAVVYWIYFTYSAPPRSIRRSPQVKCSQRLSCTAG